LWPARAALARPWLHLAQGLYGGSILLGSGFVLLAVPRIFRFSFLALGAFVLLACAAVSFVSRDESPSTL
jgi:hypothetical protein